MVQDQGRYAEAEAIYKDALAIIRKALGDAHPSTQSIARTYLTLLETHNPTSPEIPDLRKLVGR